MRNRFRVEIYDDIKSNDITIYSEQGIDKEHLIELVYSNMMNFDGNVRAFVFDKLKKKKTTAVYFPMEMIQSAKSKIPKKLDFGLVIQLPPPKTVGAKSCLRQVQHTPGICEIDHNVRIALSYN